MSWHIGDLHGNELVEMSFINEDAAWDYVDNVNLNTGLVCVYENF